MDIGDRIQFTPYAISQFSRTKGRTGVIVGMAGKRLRVKRDGLKSLTTWHPMFWEPEQPK